MTKHTLIVGASHAGVTAAEALRRNGFDGAITLLSAEACPLPYHRPPLSKAYLSGEKSAQQIALRGATFYEDNAIILRHGLRAEGLDPRARTLTAGDEVIPYDDLILATGARPRLLPGSEQIRTGLHRLRDLADADALARRRDSASRLVIAGGGFIGLEVAATFVKRGVEVIVVEPQTSLLARALPAEVSAPLLALHRAAGVEIRLGTTLTRLIHSNGRLTGVELSDGTQIATDDLLVGIGSQARLELAPGAETRLGGFAVDSHGRTSLPHVWAIGDCATQDNRFAGGPARIESVQAATDQARATGAALAGKTDAPPAAEALPWFWSDQYDWKLQMAGFIQPGAEVVLRGDPAAGAFSVLHMRGARLCATFSVNRAGDHIHARKLIASGARFDAAALTDAATPLNKCLIPEPAA
ncbi:NAD(P)/FAD-dependent oxidoreductase [Oceanicola sp. S124]|uniref:NAD(P)/FAD-dependent oxidoreductase n=1 Tax=Oceanicola sp. S124 TaxID=1042378 RepID=UPI00025584E2|nr:FAD-dependent oxidoreductase [Oceanicola sp. S124]